MSDIKLAIREALDQSSGPIDRDVVRNWMREANDLETTALLFDLTREAWFRIHPVLEQAETIALIQGYLLDCVREDPAANGVFSRYDAASELHRWFFQLAGLPDASRTLKAVAASVKQVFLQGDQQIREAIETGFLEHVLEEEKFRDLFSEWEHNPETLGSWRRALAWGRAHPGLTQAQWQKVRTQKH